ncbi:MGDG synthase family glycosyltransferase [Mangrovibacillus cuniculi]|uniref:Diacylglycerol glucosyltransferase n=1 Tax=Mangrovibacillus cuniculi TaxID=2593652 RepID=A0A7S8CB03_9BACI|nr:glycosyltransferase [Mangrovibacillus cuniculi]QPC46632.1 diacylglycerol glucosyltransferase [Mangrovibacillus cuniculi]
MKSTPSILILTAQYGTGHLQVAKTVHDSFKEKDGHLVHQCDLYEESYPAMSIITQQIFQKSFTKVGAPIYKMFYYGTDRLSKKGLSYLYQHLGKQRMKELMQTINPNLVLTTFPLHAPNALTKQPWCKTQTATIITDYCLHPLWIHQNISRYFVASKEVEDKLLMSGIKKNKITISGIPVREAFLQPVCKEEVYRRFNLDSSKQTVLLVAGALGVAQDIPTLVRELAMIPTIQLIVVCGKNKFLQETIQHSYKNSHVNIFGYVEEMHLLLEVADIFITKPGGVTITEAAIKRTPLIFFKPTPGQEKENAMYFVQKGAAFIAQTNKDILDYTTYLLHHPIARIKMKESLGEIAKPNAAYRIKEEIKQLARQDRTIQARRVL